MRKIAKEYMNHGLAVLPCKLDKSPDVKGTWKGGISDLSLYDSANGIGVICGEISGGLECLDFDSHFGDAKNTLSKFIEQIRDLYIKYNFPIEQTQSGGYHFMYRCSKIEGNLKLASKPLLDKKTNKWRPDAIIETRGEGGYFVCDPTPNYKIVRNNILDIPEITPEERDFIISICKSFNEWSIVNKETFEDKDKPGDLYNSDISAIEDMKSCLRSSGWTELSKGIWQRPGKKKGISATTGKVADNVFYNFSSNAYPFEPNAGYTPFQVVGLLEYKGDFKNFAKVLAEKYDLDKPVKKEYGKPTPKEEKKDKNELDKLLSGAFIDLDVPIPKPPNAIKIRDFENGYLVDKRMFTLSNFSAIKGKSKSKKTFLTSILLAAATRNDFVYNKIAGALPESKKGVLLFDTEQSDYDAQTTALRVSKINGVQSENFGAFGLREYTPKERCEIIDYAFEKFKGNIGYVVIDGITDLAFAINDEEEASRVVGLLMKWTKIYNCHITVVIHENKNDSYATGHIGSSILKKAEAIISVTKDESDSYTSRVKCDMIRGVSDFNEFDIEIEDGGIPVIKEMQTISSGYEIKEY